MLVCGVLLATPNAIYSPGLPLALLAWSITEIIRYGFYGFNLLNIVPDILTFLRLIPFIQFRSFDSCQTHFFSIVSIDRYTLFIVLYPTGVTGELLCLYWAQSYASKSKIWSIELPNTYNFTFSYHYFLWIVMLLYIPLFPQLYLHMFTLRKKVLGKSNVSQQSQKVKSK